MPLRIRALQIRIQSDEKMYGCDLSFADGLVLLRADNTKGKSTCIMSMLYALGLEGMLGPSHAPPLPPVMLTELKTEHGTSMVTASWVSLEIEGAESVVTVTRSVAGSAKSRERVKVTYGPSLTSPKAEFESEDFLVRTPHAAQGALGFHDFLAKFVGWQLPSLVRFDGERTILYMECLAPLFFVDQLSGWRDIKARMPTYLQIPEMAKRSVEFVLSLDILRKSIQRLELKKQIDVLNKQWSGNLARFRSEVPRIGVVLRGVPKSLGDIDSNIFAPQLLIIEEGTWTTVDDYLRRTHERLAMVRETIGRRTRDVAPDVLTQLQGLEDHMGEAESRLTTAQMGVAIAETQLASIKERLASLRDDARQFEDDYKLRTRGGRGRLRSAADVCPTCGQSLSGLLLASKTVVQPMTLDQNLGFIRDQVRTFREMESDAIRVLEGAQQARAAAAAELSALASRVQAHKALLRADADAPSTADIQEMLILQSQLERVGDAETLYKEIVAEMTHLYEQWQSVDAQLRTIGNDDISHEDKSKLNALGRSFNEQLRAYQFESYELERITLDYDTYRPSIDGVELGITSASDAIRLVWAYLVAFLETARVDTFQTDHLGLLIFDEPKQQMVADMSFRALLLRASESRQAGQQVIFATSQKKTEIENMLPANSYTLLNFEAHIISLIVTNEENPS